MTLAAEWAETADPRRGSASRSSRLIFRVQEGCDVARNPIRPRRDSSRRHYNRSTFMFRHGLSGHPLLQLPSLIDLADRLEKYDGCYWSNGSANVTDRWEKGADRRQSLRKTLENIEENNSLVILKYVVHDPIVGPAFSRPSATIVIRLAGAQNGRGCSGRPRDTF